MYERESANLEENGTTPPVVSATSEISNNNSKKTFNTFIAILSILLVLIVIFIIYSFFKKPTSFYNYKVQSSTGAYTNKVSASSHVWIFAYSHFAQVVGAPGVASKLSNTRMYEVLNLKQKPSTLLSVVPTLDFHSYQDMQQTLTKGIPSYIKAVIYDNERYKNTPAIEQKNPVLYTNKAIALAHKYSLQIICDYIEPDRYKGGYTPACDVIGLNTVQQSERSSTLYLKAVSKIVSKIRKVNKTSPISAGLSTNPRGSAVTASQLDQDIKATQTLVSGYWLNVPAPGVGCPSCNLPQPKIAIQTLLGL